MTPCSSSSGCSRWRASLNLSCKSGQSYQPLTIIPTGMGWSRTSPFRLENMMCMTFRASWLCCAVFLNDVGACQSAFCHVSCRSNENILDPSTIKMWLRNALPVFLQHYRWVAARTSTVFWALMSMCWIHFTQTFPQDVGEGTINTCKAHNDLCSNFNAWNTVHRFKERFHLAFIHCHCWGSTVRVLFVSSQPFLMAFTHLWTVSYEEAYVPQLSINDL